MSPMPTPRSTRPDAGPRARGVARSLGAFALAGATALGLAACGDETEPEVVGGPIVLSSTASTGSPGATSSASPSASTPSGTPSASDGAAPVVAVVRDGSANVDVDDQRGDGTSARVAEVKLTAGAGHVVIMDPRTRQVLGSATVASGTTRGVTVPLTTPVAASGELVALLHVDDGDGRFDPATDGVVVDDDDDEAVDDDFDYTLG
jgi:hypothetical protein